MKRRLVLELGCAVVATPLVAHAESAAVTFMGFQSFPDQTSRIFIHVTKRPEVRVDKQAGRITYVLSDTTILVRNNKNPLNLEHFKTPAKRASLVPQGSDVHVVIELKQDVDPSHAFADNTDGTVSLQIDFPRPVSRRG